jgi:hypothetical protein
MNKYPLAKDYFPIYKEGYLPPRDYFWKVFGTLYYPQTKMFIDVIRSAKIKEKEETDNKTIEIDADLLDEIHRSQYFSKKKGRALFAMDFSKIKAPKRKRTHIDLFRDDIENDIINKISNIGSHLDEQEKERLIDEMMKKRLNIPSEEGLVRKDKRPKMMSMPVSEHKDSEGISKQSYGETSHKQRSPDAIMKGSGDTQNPLGFPETYNPFAGKRTVVVGKNIKKLGSQDAYKSSMNPFRKD